MGQLTTQDIKHFRSRLITLQAELQALEGVGKEAAQTVKLDQSCVGRLSRMDAMQAQAMSQETNRRRTIELQQIDIALRRIDDGTFGFCLRCDELLSIGRLEANPTATLCINCASQAER